MFYFSEAANLGEGVASAVEWWMSELAEAEATLHTWGVALEQLHDAQAEEADE